MNRQYLPAAAAAVAMVATMAVLGGCAVSEATDTSRDARGFAWSGSHLTVSSNADVTVSQGTQTSGVRASRLLKGKAALAGNATWALDGDTLRLDAKCKGLAINCSAHYTISVPRGTTVTVADSDGNVAASGLTGGLTAAVTNGDLRVSDVSGAVSLTAGNGDVSAANVTGHLVARATDGNVHVTGASQAVDIAAASGDVDVTGMRGDDLVVSAGDGHVHLSCAAAPTTVRVTTSNGDASLTLPSVAGGYRLAVTAHNGTRHATVADTPGSARSVSLDADDGDATVSAV